MLRRFLLLGGLVLAVVPGPASATPGGPFSFVPAPGGPRTVGQRPTKVVSADFDQDGRPDLAIADQHGDQVSVLLGDGTGGFASPIATPTRKGPNDLSAGDLNGDGRPDLAVADYGADTVSVLLGNGDGSFTPAPGSPYTIGSCPSAVAIADFNGDGLADVAAANACAPSGVVTLPGDGTGGFAPARRFPMAAPAVPWALAVADLNGDGRPDLAVADYAQDTVPVLLSGADGAFTAAPGGPAVSTAAPDAIAVGDFDEDGRPDVALANAVGSGAEGSAWTSLTVLLGNGHGGFGPAPRSPYTMASTGMSVAVADLDGDGHEDLVGADATGALATFLGDGHCHFAIVPGPAPSAGSAPGSVVAVDLDGDRRPDLAATSTNLDTVSVFLNRPMAAAAAQLTGPTRCVSGPHATFTVRGPQVRAVTFRLDHRWAPRRTLLHPNSARDGFRLTIPRSRLPVDRHTVEAMVSFKTGEALRVLTQTFRRCHGR
jgi:hypothetical protein